MQFKKLNHYEKPKTKEFEIKLGLNLHNYIMQTHQANNFLVQYIELSKRLFQLKKLLLNILRKTILATMCLINAELLKKYLELNL